MSAFEITEEHLVFLTSMVLQGGSVRSDRFSPVQVQMVIELVEGQYLSREEEGACSAWAYYSMNDLSLKVVKNHGHNVLDDALAKLTEKNILKSQKSPLREEMTSGQRVILVLLLLCKGTRTQNMSAWHSLCGDVGLLVEEAYVILERKLIESCYVTTLILTEKGRAEAVLILGSEKEFALCKVILETNFQK